jgi:hypothetical protein
MVFSLWVKITTKETDGLQNITGLIGSQAKNPDKYSGFLAPAILYDRFKLIFSFLHKFHSYERVLCLA